MLAMEYATARLRSQDEARSAELTRDRRVYRPDPDEVGPVACVICEAPVPRSRSGQGLVCPRCRANGWTAATCACGAWLTRNDQKAEPMMRARCKACRKREAQR